MLVIPLDAVPSQVLTTNLDNQPCQISVYQKQSGLYLDLFVNNTLIIGGVLCLNRTRIVRDLYLGFLGDLAFLDNQGNDDPIFIGLGGRFTLMYILPSELPSGVG